MRFIHSLVYLTLPAALKRCGYVVAQVECGPNGTLSLSGSSTVQPIADVWAKGYMEMCPGIVVNVAGGGSSVGARAVCSSSNTSVDIGNMSREWRIGNEVNVTDAASRKYICNTGSKTRTLTQVDVGIDGLTVATVNGGVGSQCFRTMEGRGLKIDQLRWIYSNYTSQQLEETGWDSTVIVQPDGAENTHFFKELSKAQECRYGEIRLYAPGSLSGTFDFFRENVFVGSNEGIGTIRPFPLKTSEDDRELVMFLESQANQFFGDSICFFGYSYYAAEGTYLYGIPIKAKGGPFYYPPTLENIEAGVYQPFTRRLYMNVFDGSMTSAGPFISYGLSREGIKKLLNISIVPPPSNEIASILSRIGRDPPPVAPPTKRPSRAPANIPTLAPAALVKPCGLFGLGIFCPSTFCGFFGRLFGLCRVPV